MNLIDNLRLIDGYFDGDRFVMRGISGHAIYGTYKAAGLTSMANLIHENESFNLRIDENRVVLVPIELNADLKQELLMIAEELEKLQY